MTTATEDVPIASPTLGYATSVQPAAPAGQTIRGPFRIRWHVLTLLGIVLLGGVLRFSFMSRPLLWGDDAYTVYRTHADYQAMLNILQNDGFTPLHYELYWLLGRAAGTKDSIISSSGQSVVHSVGMTPLVVRLLPAFWGTLMVPAMYLLAVHLVRRRTALVIALFTACSAYLLGYSRDGKMYIMQWSLSALSAGCLLWWFKSGLRIAWLAWVASSLGMASSHMTGMALLPLEALFFLTRSNVHWKQSILFVIGLAIAIVPPAGYMTQFNRWVQDQVEDFGFEVEGLGWIGPYNEGRTGPELVRYAASAYLFSWEWPKSVHSSKRPAADPSTERGIPTWILIGLKTATALFILLAAAGAMPWSRKLRGIRDDEPTPPQPWWRVVLWIGAWLIIPIYFIYCRSVTDFASPKDWWGDIGAFLAGNAWTDPAGGVRIAFWIVLAVAAAIVATLVFFFPRFRRAVVLLFPLLAVAGLLVAILRSGIPSATPRGAEWVGPVARPIQQWTDWMADPVLIAGLVIVLPGVALFYCAPTWRKRLARVGQFAVVTAALLACCWVIYDRVQNKFNKEVAQVLEPSAQDTTASAVLARYSPGQIEQAKERVEARAWQSIFMPRYVGFVWIAFGIALCALLMRLPTRGLRIAAIALLLGVNLAQFAGRLFAGTEPPLDRVAHDVWRYDSHNPQYDPTGRVYVDDSPVGGSGHPGWGLMAGQQGKYYLGLERGYWIHPTEWKSASSTRYFDIHPIAGSGGPNGGGPRRGNGSAGLAGLASEARSGTLKRVIVWEKHFGESSPDDMTAADPVERILGEHWERKSLQDYTVRFHWNWAQLYVYRRSEYVKKETATPAVSQSSTTSAH